MTEKTISVFDRYFEALSNMDQDQFVSCFTPEAELHDPYGGRPFVGSDGLSKWFAGFLDTWERFSISAEVPFTCKENTAVKWTARGEAKSRKVAEFSGINLFTVNMDGKIERMDGYWDAPAMLAQIRA